MEIELEDSTAIAGSVKGKQQEGTVNDAELALEMYIGEIRACQRVLEDREMAECRVLETAGQEYPDCHRASAETTQWTAAAVDTRSNQSLHTQSLQTPISSQSGVGARLGYTDVTNTRARR